MKSELTLCEAVKCSEPKKVGNIDYGRIMKNRTVVWHRHFLAQCMLNLSTFKYLNEKFVTML